MKQNQFTIILVGLSLLTLLFLSCKKEETYMSNANIIGLDARMCACCGGTEIVIDNVANPNGNSYFLTGQLPADFNLGNNPKFPIAVKIDFKIDSAHCFGNYIKITRISRR
jgi:hypothetical protein